MAFTLNCSQQQELRLLDVFPEEDAKDFFDSLEAHMVDSSIKRAGEQFGPVIIGRNKLNKIKVLSGKLESTLKTLESGELRKLNVIVGQEYFLRKHLDEKQLRWTAIDLPYIFHLVAQMSEELVDDSLHKYGSRHADKPISYLIEFWQNTVEEPITPISNKGKFVMFISIILEKEMDASRNLLNEYLKRWPYIEPRQESGD